MSESLELLSPRIEATGADIRVDVESISIIGDRSRLQEIFLNLLENSLKFCRSEAAPTVVVSAACHDEVVLCSISDDGIGIGPSYHDRVFELFERLDKGIEGTGVGLALLKRIVELHGGKIWVSSEGTDRGTTFHFTFPLRSDGEFDIGGQMVAVVP